MIARHEPGGRGSAGLRSQATLLRRGDWLPGERQCRELPWFSEAMALLREADRHLAAAGAHLRAPAFDSLRIVGERAARELAAWPATLMRPGRGDLWDMREGGGMSRSLLCGDAFEGPAP